MGSDTHAFPRGEVRRVTLVAALLYALFTLRCATTVLGETHWVLFDDAMISMHFASNLAHGHGLVWNPGEPAVEGYTNFLWTVLMAGVHLLPLAASKTSLVVMALSGVILTLNVSVVARLAFRLTRDAPVAVGAAALVAFSYPLAYWSLSGMEVGLLVLLLDLALLVLLDVWRAPTAASLAKLSALLSALVLTRTDLVAAGGVVALAASYGAPKGARLRTFAALAAALALTLAAHTALRVAWYGDPLPNTYYLKATGVPLLTRLRRGALYLAWCGATNWWAVALPAVIAAATLRRRPSLPVATLAMVAVTQVAYSVYVGGDAWEYLDLANRYITTAAGPFAVLAAMAVSRLHREGEASLTRLLRALAALAACGLAMHAVEAWRWPTLVSATAGTLAQRGLIAGFTLGAAALAVFAWRRASVEGFAASVRASRVAVPALCVTALAVSDGLRWAYWVVDNPSGYVSQRDNARLGLLLRESLAPGTHFAEFSAGAITYFAQRPMVDLLGKCDPVIAREAPRGRFLPGHNKWDFDHSIRALRPEVVVRLWNDSIYTSTVPWERWGYERLHNGVHVRRDATGVDRALLGVDWRDPAAVASALRARDRRAGRLSARGEL
ncbi:MAG: hypothetical protein R3A52_22285 [Polyangiales bacterium]